MQYVCVTVCVCVCVCFSELDLFRNSGGTPPQCGVTLCFGEELDTEDISGKLITVHVSVLIISTT